MRVFSAEHGRGPKDFSSDALDMLVDYSWPGNVRELRNEIERLVIMVQDDVIQADDLSLPNGTGSARASTLHEARAQYEREFILSKLKENNWNISQTATAAGTGAKLSLSEDEDLRNREIVAGAVETQQAQSRHSHSPRLVHHVVATI